jgi:DUF2934 family protein
LAQLEKIQTNQRGVLMETPTEEQIRRCAYEVYMKYGEPGRDAQNWLEAELELQQVQKIAETEAADWEQKVTRQERDVKRVALVSSGRKKDFQKRF